MVPQLPAGIIRRASKLICAPAESFLGSVPSWPQAFGRVYGTIQTVSPTQIDFGNSNVGSVEETGGPFPLIE